MGIYDEEDMNGFIDINIEDFVIIREFSDSQ